MNHNKNNVEKKVQPSGLRVSISRMFSKAEQVVKLRRLKLFS